ncbi:glycosyltransferase family 4 protein [Psychroserpens sp. MEBiC05023]
MKIGLVLASAPGYSETFFFSKIKGLQNSGHNVCVFCADNSKNFSACQVVLFPKLHTSTFIQLFMLLRVYLSLIPYLKPVLKFIKLERKDGVSWLRLLKRIYNYAPIFKIQLDWLHFGFGTLAIGGENLAESISAKMAVSFRGFDIGVYPVKYPNCYRNIWDKVDKIHVISDDISELLYQNGFNDQAPVIKITPAINTAYFSSTSNHTLKKMPIQLISVARLHWKKGLHYTIEALSLLKQKGVNFQYRIIGTGIEEEALKFAAYQYNLQNEIIFMGKLKHESVKDELTKSDIYIQYSVQEGFCNAVLEAQAMGLMCVVSNAEGLSENIQDKQSGWVVPKRNPIALASKLFEVINLSEAKKNEIKTFAISRIQKEFNLTKQEKEFIAFYEDYL